MGSLHPRLVRESWTVERMIRLYCRAQHGAGRLPCPACAELHAYALERLRRCPFREGKTTCARCPVHCYRRDRREQVRVVMRYAGPRFYYRHPVLTLGHWLDGLRRSPIRRDRRLGQAAR